MLDAEGEVYVDEVYRDWILQFREIAVEKLEEWLGE